MANAYVSSVAHAAVAQWAANTAYSLGQFVRQLAAPAVGSERVFKCTTAGTSHLTTEPTWNLTNNATTSDNTAVWTQVAGQEAEQSAGNWTAPHARIDSARSVLSLTASDTIFVSNDHAETKAATSSIGTIGNVLSVSRVGATIPPTSADLLAGASVATTGANSISIGAMYGYGLTFTAASGSSNGSISLAAASGAMTALDDCAFILNTTNAAPQIVVGVVTHTAVKLKNPTFTFGAVGQNISVFSSNLEIVGGSLSGGTVPTSMFTGNGGNAGHQNIDVRGCDLSAASGTVLTMAALTGHAVFADCKLHASATLASGTIANSLAWARFHNCDDSTSGLNYSFQEFYRWGSVTADIAVCRSGGASDGVASYSHKFTVSATPTLTSPFTGNWISKRQNAVGSGLTCTIELIYGGAAGLKNDQVWVEMQSLDTSNAPISALHSSRVADVLAAGSTLTASTEAWDGGAAARANSTAYSLGDIRKVSSNSGRLFVCTTAGTTAGSLPGGYATAVDGDSVTDNTAVFRAMWRHKVALSFTPQMRGMVRARVNINLAAAATVYVDPKLTIA